MRSFKMKYAIERMVIYAMVNIYIVKLLFLILKQSTFILIEIHFIDW